jgi:hypothetical protein
MSNRRPKRSTVFYHSSRTRTAYAYIPGANMGPVAYSQESRKDVGGLDQIRTIGSEFWKDPATTSTFRTEKSYEA